MDICYLILLFIVEFGGVLSFVEELENSQENVVDDEQIFDTGEEFR